MRNLGKKAILGLSICACGALVAHAGPEWPEMGDAGNLPMSAQPINGGGALGKITGGLNGGSLLRGGDYQDMYLIYIKDPTMFSATTNPAAGGSTSFDSQLFLFDSTGLGVVANDETAPGSLYSTLTNMDSGGTTVVDTAGLYYLAISGFDSNPENGSGLLFEMMDRTEVTGPDGPGGTVPITGWDIDGATGTYEIVLTGVSLVPSPGASVSLLTGAAIFAGRRRRR